MHSTVPMLSHRSSQGMNEVSLLPSPSTREKTPEKLNNLSKVSLQKVTEVGFEPRSAWLPHHPVLSTATGAAPKISRYTQNTSGSTVQVSEPAEPLPFVLFLSFQLLGWGSKPPTLQSTVNNKIKHRKWFITVSLKLNNEGQEILRKLIFPLWGDSAVSWMGASFTELWSQGLGGQAPCRLREQAASGHGPAAVQYPEQTGVTFQMTKSPFSSGKWKMPIKGRERTQVLPQIQARGLSWLISFNPQNIPKWELVLSWLYRWVDRSSGSGFSKNPQILVTELDSELSSLLS